MSKKAIFLAIFAMAAVSVMAQYDGRGYQRARSTQLFYAELGGPGVIMSLNYDRRFTPNSRTGFGFRAGVGFGIGGFEENRIYNNYGGGYDYDYVTHSYYSFPVQVNYVFGREDSRSMLEVGAGASVLTRKVDLYNYDDNSKRGYFIGHLLFMYRLQPLNSGFAFRVGFTPIIGTGGDLFPMVALSLGYAF
jgi:hypothetical protein